MLGNVDLILNTWLQFSLAVAAIPEGICVAVVTIVLSMGVTRMSERHAIVDRLTTSWGHELYFPGYLLIRPVL